MNRYYRRGIPCGDGRRPLTGRFFRREIPCTVDALLDVQFDTLSLGSHSAASFLTATGLTFTRNSVSTVQTSDATVVTDLAIDAAAIGNRGTVSNKRGLVLQTNTLQAIPAVGVRSQAPSAAWSVGTMTTTASSDVSADGTVAGSRSAGASGTYGSWGAFGAPEDFNVLSSWQLDKGANGMQSTNQINLENTGVAVLRATSASWGRIILARPATPGVAYPISVDCRNFASVGGESARSRDVLVDLVQYERGHYAHEAHLSGVRHNDRLSAPTASSLVASNGQIKFYASFTPKHSSAMPITVYGIASGTVTLGVNGYLWSYGVALENYARINNNKTVTVRIGLGTAITSSNAMVFGQFDTVEIYVAAGAGLSSVAKYRVNGGAWTDLVLAAVANTPNPGAAPLGIFMHIGSGVTVDPGQIPCWLHRVTLYRADGAPAGV